MVVQVGLRKRCVVGGAIICKEEKQQPSFVKKKKQQPSFVKKKKQQEESCCDEKSEGSQPVSLS